MTHLEVGQIWRDNDPREGGNRTVTIKALDPRFAYVESNKGKLTTIRRVRFGQETQKGFTLVSGAP